MTDSGAAPVSTRARLWADLRVVLPVWITARLLVAAGFVLAHTVVGELDIDPRPVQLDEGLLSWDGTFYRDIADQGYESLADQPLRFFPLYPLVGRVLSPLALGRTSVALVVAANLLAVVVGVLTRRLVLFEKGDEALADRATWLMLLVPPAFVLSFAYSEALFLTLALATFSALRHERWWWAALFGALAALTRPFGLVLAVPALVEVWRHRQTLADRAGVGAAAAVTAPAVGTGLYLLYTRLSLDTWLGPFSTQRDYRGDLVDAVSRLARGVGDLAGEETFGDGLHIPFAVLALVLVGLTFRYWPAGYGLFAAILVVGAVSADNLNSTERYVLNAFPVVWTLAVLISEERLERAVLAVCGGGLVSFTALALLGVYVP